MRLLSISGSGAPRRAFARAGVGCLAVAVLALIASCEAATEPLPNRATLFTPSSIYAQWWSLVSECAGLSGDLERLSWYYVPGVGAFTGEPGVRVLGRWDPWAERIILADGARSDGGVVRHEMLHALLWMRRQRESDAAHPRDYFVKRCGGTVECVDACLEEEAPAAADPASVTASPSSLSVEVHVIPSAPGAGVADGFFMVIVTAENPSDHPVEVTLPTSGSGVARLSYRIEVDDLFGNGWWSDVESLAPEDARFAAHERKRFVFDLRARPGRTRWELPAGTYVFRGAFGGMWAPDPPTVTLTP